jgi:hypothetical protein
MIWLLIFFLCLSPTNAQLNLSARELHTLGLLAIEDYPKRTFCPNWSRR